jgi:hypothetical protein
MKARFFKTIKKMMKFISNSIVGKKGIHGCDLVEVVSIIVNGFVKIKSMHPNDNEKVFEVNIDEIDFI